MRVPLKQNTDHLTPPTTPSPDDFLTHPIKMNGIGHCALHTPLPTPPKPPLKGIPEKTSFLRLQQGRQKLIVGSIIFLCLALLLGVGLPFALDLRASRLLEARLQVVQRILSDVPLVDGHNELAWNIRRRKQNKLFDFKFDSDLTGDAAWNGGALWSQTDLVRMKKGLVSAQVRNIYVFYSGFAIFFQPVFKKSFFWSICPFKNASYHSQQIYLEMKD